MTAPAKTRHEAEVGLPWWMWIPASIGFALIALPVFGLLLRADWAEMPSLLRKSVV